VAGLRPGWRDRDDFACGKDCRFLRHVRFASQQYVKR